MPGSFGTTPATDGGDSFTTSSANSGFFARNNATAAAPAPAGGNGVFGLSTVPNASGVFGVNDGASANGVAGISKNGTGVFAQGGKFAGFFVGNVQVTYSCQARTARSISTSLGCSRRSREPSW